MSFAQQYEAHAYHDLIAEAEKQGIGVGVAWERERIIKLLEDKALWLAHLDRLDEVELLRNFIALIKGENKDEDEAK